jgi:shikimate kinase
VNTDKLYLVGFMGAGKTSVARALGKRIDWRVADIDERIEARERRSVTAIFHQDSESYFRRAERLELLDLVAQRHLVVAAGGGTFADPENRATMLADGAVAWLDVPLSYVLARIPQDGRRPLVHDRAQLEALYLSREAAYHEAHVRIDGIGPIGEIVERLMAWMDY